VVLKRLPRRSIAINAANDSIPPRIGFHRILPRPSSRPWRGGTPQEPPEEELWRGGYSSKAMTGAWTTSGLVSLGLLIAGVFWVREAAHWLILVLAMLLPWLYCFGVLCYAG